jgi:acyl phosphate:glycerol-3-phosphate acyltransferase
LLILLLLIASYLIGSIPTGLIVGRLSGFDPRAVGSGNIGASNVARAGGASAAAITFLGDMLKGLIPVLVARLAGFDARAVAAVALAAFVGSICSVFLRFSGGKGGACAVGIWLAISPLAIGIALLVFLALVAVWRIMSLSLIGAVIAGVPAVALTGSHRSYFALAVVMGLLLLWRHRENINRLIARTEPVVGAPKSEGLAH